MMLFAPFSAWVTPTEHTWSTSRERRRLGWREFSNRREVGGSVGLGGTPYDSGQMEREQGISKAGNSRVRERLVELSWLWLRYQPNSSITLWFQKRFGAGGKRAKRIGIVAVARKLLIQLWHFVEHDVVPSGAIVVTP
jgi:transposase